MKYANSSKKSFSMDNNLNKINISTLKKFHDEEILRFWQIFIPWLVKRSDSYRIVCEPGKNGSSKIIGLLNAHATKINVLNETKFNRIIRKIFKEKLPFVFEGKPDTELNDILLSRPLPDESVPTDIAPMMEIILSRRGKQLFTSYDYGRFQTIFITDQEIKQLKKLLLKHKIPMEILNLIV